VNTEDDVLLIETYEHVFPDGSFFEFNVGDSETLQYVGVNDLVLMLIKRLAGHGDFIRLRHHTGFLNGKNFIVRELFDNKQAQELARVENSAPQESQ
jgi:hypothetical protein